MAQTQHSPLGGLSGLSKDVGPLAGRPASDSRSQPETQQLAEARRLEVEAMRRARQALTLRGADAFNCAALATNAALRAAQIMRGAQ